MNFVIVSKHVKFTKAMNLNLIIIVFEKIVLKRLQAFEIKLNLLFFREIFFWFDLLHRKHNQQNDQGRLILTNEHLDLLTIENKIHSKLI
jgi:hypothetical protein